MKTTDAFIVARNTVRVLLDSTRLDDILEVGEITGRPAMQRALEQVHAREEGRALLQDRPELRSDRVALPDLRELPTDTIGHLFVSHIDKYGLDINALNKPEPKADDSDLTYILRRYRGNHDIWHAVLGLGTEGYEEVLVHAFTYGQLRFPLSSLIVFFGSLKHIVLEGRWEVLKSGLNDAYALGKHAEPLVSVYWERHWDKPLSEIRAMLGLPADPWGPTQSPSL